MTATSSTTNGFPLFSLSYRHIQKTKLPSVVSRYVKKKIKTNGGYEKPRWSLLHILQNCASVYSYSLNSAAPKNVTVSLPL